ncbi:MAG: hypothetical protein PSX80_03110 [bacterium]|nr:hypothetical protein [bacterium]
MADWRELMQAGEFVKAEEAMLAETEGRDGYGPDAETRGWFYESWGDAIASSPEAERKYMDAYNNFAIFASWSTSGGEGTARMMDVNRALKKAEDCRSKA